MSPVPILIDSPWRRDSSTAVETNLRLSTSTMDVSSVTASVSSVQATSTDIPSSSSPALMTITKADISINPTQSTTTSSSTLPTLTLNLNAPTVSRPSVIVPSAFTSATPRMPVPASFLTLTTPFASVPTPASLIVSSGPSSPRNSPSFSSSSIPETTSTSLTTALSSTATAAFVASPSSPVKSSAAPSSIFSVPSTSTISPSVTAPPSPDSTAVSQIGSSVVTTLPIGTSVSAVTTFPPISDLVISSSVSTESRPVFTQPPSPPSSPSSSVMIFPHAHPTPSPHTPPGFPIPSVTATGSAPVVSSNSPTLIPSATGGESVPAVPNSSPISTPFITQNISTAPNPSSSIPVPTVTISSSIAVNDVGGGSSLVANPAASSSSPTDTPAVATFSAVSVASAPITTPPARATDAIGPPSATIPPADVIVGTGSVKVTTSFTTAFTSTVIGGSTTSVKITSAITITIPSSSSPMPSCSVQKRHGGHGHHCNKGINSGLLAGAVVATVFGILLVVIAGILACRRRRSRSTNHFTASMRISEPTPFPTSGQPALPYPQEQEIILQQPYGQRQYSTAGPLVHETRFSIISEARSVKSADLLDSIPMTATAQRSVSPSRSVPRKPVPDLLEVPGLPPRAVSVAGDNNSSSSSLARLSNPFEKYRYVGSDDPFEELQSTVVPMDGGRHDALDPQQRPQDANSKSLNRLSDSLSYIPMVDTSMDGLMYGEAV